MRTNKTKGKKSQRLKKLREKKTKNKGQRQIRNTTGYS